MLCLDLSLFYWGWRTVPKESIGEMVELLLNSWSAILCYFYNVAQKDLPYIFCPILWLFIVSGQWHPIPVLLPGKSHGPRSLVGFSPWGRRESDMTERLHFHFSLACIGEGNGNPLQCSCLEYPSDGGAWWAAVYGVAQSRTRLKQLSSSSSIVSGLMQGWLLYCCQK